MCGGSTQNGGIITKIGDVRYTNVLRIVSADHYPFFSKYFVVKSVWRIFLGEEICCSMVIQK